MSLIRKSNQKTFLDVYSNIDEFYHDFDTAFSVFKPSDMTTEYITKTYWLIVSRFGDQAILGYNDEARWKLKLFSLINQYGPTWEKRSEIQKNIRALTLDELKETGKTIYNTALNPNNKPTVDELPYVSQQNTNKITLNAIDAYTSQAVQLDDGLDTYYLDHFKELFSKFLLPDRPLYVYENEDGDSNE